MWGTPVYPVTLAKEANSDPTNTSEWTSTGSAVCVVSFVVGLEISSRFWENGRGSDTMIDKKSCLTRTSTMTVLGYKPLQEQMISAHYRANVTCIPRS